LRLSSQSDEEIRGYRERLAEKFGADILRELDKIDRKIDEEISKKGEHLEKAIQMAKADADRYNASEGSLTGYNCKLCNNRGDFAVASGEYVTCRPCKCLKARKAIENLHRSGLAKVIERYSFKNFDTATSDAEQMKKMGLEYLKSGVESGAWLFMGGQVGIGKTHICTAVCGELLRKAHEVVYMLWRDESRRLKMSIGDDDYDEELERFKLCEVLYIDDLLKRVSQDKQQGYTNADIGLLFEIINSRYANNRVTIISSERKIYELMEIDEAIGSRIYERAKGFTLHLAEGPGKNRRTS
jgi:DNA replication protein DnaC